MHASDAVIASVTVHLVSSSCLCKSPPKLAVVFFGCCLGWVSDRVIVGLTTILMQPKKQSSVIYAKTRQADPHALGLVPLEQLYVWLLRRYSPLKYPSASIEVLPEVRLMVLRSSVPSCYDLWLFERHCFQKLYCSSDVVSRQA